MADQRNGGIVWTNQTWNPIRGCTRVSAGCMNCYAESMAARFCGFGQPYEGTINPETNRWNGTVRLVPEKLSDPLRWQRPRMVFVNSMSDLFHEAVPDEFIDHVFAVMALAKQHTFQCLTKRPERARAYCSDAGVTHRIAMAIDAILVNQQYERDSEERWAKVPGWEEYEASTHGRVRRDGEMLAQTLNSLYLRPSITLWRDNEPTTAYVHKLILMAHCGLAKDGDEARHRNGNRQDNRLANLEWSSRSDNQGDKVRHGSNGGPAKITREQAAEIRELRRTGRTQQSIADEYCVSRSLISMIESRNVWPDALDWPLPNVWLGVTVENQETADERIPLLLQTPAAVRWVSMEPLLEAVTIFSLDGIIDIPDGMDSPLHWVVVGGESGTNARPMHPDWVRGLRDQCAAAGVPFLMKQLSGEKGKVIKDISLFPADLQIREYPHANT